MYQEALTDKGRELFSKLANFKGFYLAGGTALALQIGHRISIDFDLFSKNEIKRNLFSLAKEIFDGAQISPSVDNSDELTLFVEGIKITFLHYPFPIIFPLVEQETISLLSVKELAGTKAYTIGRRGSYKDYVDLYDIVKQDHASIVQVLTRLYFFWLSPPMLHR